MKKQIEKISKKLQKFIDSISFVGDSTIPDDDGKIYYSKIDSSYLTRVGMENELNFLLKRGITEGVQNKDNNPTTSNIGFNPTEQKWYGWSHRAIYGFGVGSEVKRGDSGYQPKDKESFLENLERLNNTFNNHHNFTYSVKENGIEEISIFLGYPDNKNQDKFIGDKNTNFYKYPENWGKGEWKAETLEDAKQMAIDFARSVS